MQERVDVLAAAAQGDIATFGRLATQFRFYAPNMLQITDKQTRIRKPFVFNAAQTLLDEQVEKIRAEVGYVRAIIVKGRQQGCCLGPKTRVLTADLRWRPIGELRVGDEVVATDEDARGQIRGRKLRTATVEAVMRTVRPAFRLTLADGREVVTSDLHRWLTKKSQDGWAWRSVRGGKGSITAGTCLRSITTPWGEPDADDGWFGGMIDGEGSMDQSPSRVGVRLAIHQVAGPVHERLKAHCEQRGFPYHVVTDGGERRTKLGLRPVHALNIASIGAMFRVLGLSRPTRFEGRRWWEGKALPKNGAIEVVSIEALGEQPVIDIQTSCATFIAEGFVSHNSTYITGRGYQHTTMNRNHNTSVIAHLDDATLNLFRMVQEYHENAPFKPTLNVDRGNKMRFGSLNSQYMLSTARSKGAGRSSNIQYFHGSEVAFWPNLTDNMAAIGQALALAPGTEAYLETTAQGRNEFYAMAMSAVKGDSDYRCVFIPWFLQPEYARDDIDSLDMDGDEWEYMDTYGLSMKQMRWRQGKIASDFSGDATLFDQEYPASLARAFSRTGTAEPFILPSVVERSRKRDRTAETQGREILGVDPSQGRRKNDRFAIIGRNAVRVTFKKALKTTNDDTMLAAEQIARIVHERNPIAVFVDRLGLGAGVCDRLSELLEGNATKVIGVKASEFSLDEQYNNKRTEMWGGMRAWATDADLLDDDEIEADLTGPGYRFMSGKYLLESKESMVKRKLPSPDFGDALAHTFYVPIELIEGRSREDLRSGLSHLLV